MGASEAQDQFTYGLLCYDVNAFCNSDGCDALSFVCVSFINVVNIF